MEYMNTSFRKKEIMPKIMVYRNVFDADKVLSIIKESEHRADCKLITPWRQWLHLGTMANEISLADSKPERSKSEHFNNNEDKSTFLFKERDFQVTIRNAYNKVAFDYASQYKDESGWPEWIKTWDLNDSIWGTDKINILKYRMHRFFALKIDICFTFLLGIYVLKKLRVVADFIGRQL